MRFPTLGSLTRGTGLFAVARVTSQLGSFLATLVAARFLGVSGFGQYALLLAAAAIVVNGLGTGVPVLALRESASGYLTEWLKRRLVLTVIAATAVGTCLTAGFGALVLPAPLGIVGGALAGSYFSVACLVALGSAFHTGLGRLKHAAIGEALLGVVLPFATLAALKEGWGILGALAGLVVGPIPAIVWLYATIPSLPSASRGLAPRLLRESLSFVGLGLASGGYARVDTVVLRLVSDPVTVGVYAVAYRLVGPLQVVLSAFGTVFFARVSAARGSGADWRPALRTGRLWLVLTLAPLVVLGVLLAPVAIRLLYGSEYATAVLPAQILLASMLPVAWSWPSGHTLNAYGRQGVWVLILAVGIALDAVLVLLLGRVLGATGAAIAWVTVETLTVGLVTKAMRRMP